jgi:NADH dehydrogenase
LRIDEAVESLQVVGEPITMVERTRTRAGRTPRCLMSPKRIIVLGGGFAGLWSAVGAARKLDELGHGPDAVEVSQVNRDAFHNIRVRNYEADLTEARVPLDAVLGPVGVRRVQGEVVGIDLPGRP